MTESNAVQRLRRVARRQGLKLSFRQNPERRYRLIDPRTERTIVNTESLIDIERFLAAGELYRSTPIIICGCKATGRKRL